jgi:hypothetical protein
MHRVAFGLAARFLILWIPFFMAAASFGQDSTKEELTPPPNEVPPPPAPEPEPLAPSVANQTSSVANDAVLEGIQVSSEPSKDNPKDFVVTCYFIFRDKPSSYFYESKRKNKKLVFEFNDAQKGTSPIPSQKVIPIEGFEIDQRQVDVNKEVKGLNPELHDQLYVTFSLDAIPKIHVADEYNVISFTFTWSSDPTRVAKYIDNTGGPNWGLMGGLAGGGAVAVGVALYFLLKPPPSIAPPSPLDTSDLPSHSQEWRW